MNNSDRMQIVLCADQNAWKGVIAVLQSIVKNTHAINRINCTLVVDSVDTQHFYNREVTRYPVLKPLTVQTFVFDEQEFVKANMRVEGQSVHIKNVMNFSRFYLPDLLDVEIDWILYIDTDMIVLGDLWELWHLSKKACSEAIPFAAVRDSARKEAGNFNAGLFCTSMKYWRDNNSQNTAFK